jgi:hypothetical protein
MHGEKRSECTVFVGKPEGKYHYKDLDMDGRII